MLYNGAKKSYGAMIGANFMGRKISLLIFVVASFAHIEILRTMNSAVMIFVLS